MAGRAPIRELVDEDFCGFDLNDIKCRSCSGYGNCGYKSYGIYKGKPVSICIRTREDMIEERDGVRRDLTKLV